ncbi:hypothetical protein V1477_014692 [Vespula maculifrons]|uniref:Uncharacterized protein n=1 Tax=Vespula maculifrons TaxID=7453 RepID=A0ABD2BI63_VESMC
MTAHHERSTGHDCIVENLKDDASELTLLYPWTVTDYVITVCECFVIIPIETFENTNVINIAKKFQLFPRGSAVVLETF